MARLLFARMKISVLSRPLGRLWLFGLLMLMAGLTLPVMAEDGEGGGPPIRQTPIPTATPRPGKAVTDRLAPPPTVPAPTQADDGAQLYWLHCQPCHGDNGQGLTDEWRAEYPLEEQYCWESGCHGERPYEDGFTLPFTVPAVIGEGTLTRYQTVGGLYRYIQTTMPFWNPNSLTDEEYLAITAHLARAHSVWDGTPLTDGNVDGFVLPAGLAANRAETSAPPATEPASPAPSQGSGFLWGGLALTFLILAAGVWLWQRSNR